MTTNSAKRPHRLSASKNLHFQNRKPSTKARANRKWFSMELLESRIVLSSYELSINQWASKDRLTYSIPADGVVWYHGVNSINSSFDNLLGPGWKLAIAEAMSDWSSAANIDIAQVSDQGGDSDYEGLPQGDPRFGDIRIGGYDFQNNVIMAVTEGPPPSGYTRAGDIQVNTGLSWNLGKDYDFQTVILHELGHSLGLEHPSDSASIMYERYQGVRRSLDSGDLQGLLEIYGPRTPDSLNAQGYGLTLASPIAVPKPTVGARASILNGLSLAKTDDSDYFEITVPKGFIGTSLAVTASAKSLSMLSPKLSLIGTSGEVLQKISYAGSWGACVSLNLGQVQAGQTLRFRVEASEAGRFDIGGYTVKADFQGGEVPAANAPPVNPPPPPAKPANPPVVVPPTSPKPPVVVAPPTPKPVPHPPTVVKPVVVSPTRPSFFQFGKQNRVKPIKKAAVNKPVNGSRPAVKRGIHF